jgi:hypothetical protein
VLLFFADDARQQNPSRMGMGSLVGAGAIRVKDEDVRVLELQLSKLCSDFGFPDGAEFKWSPGRELWMRDNLRGSAREAFFIKALEIARARRIVATVVIADTNEVDPRTGTQVSEADVTRLLLEAIHLQIPIDANGLVIADRPGGGRPEEDSFLSGCMDTLKVGTRHVRNLELISLMLTANSKMVRLLQLADLVTSCTTAFVAGNGAFAPAIFDQIRPLLRMHQGRVGGVGLKLLPAERYANLYHWIGGDTDYVHDNTTYRMPLPRYPYHANSVNP